MLAIDGKQTPPLHLGRLMGRLVARPDIEFMRLAPRVSFGGMQKREALESASLFHCPSRFRTWTLLIQNQACCQLHQGAVSCVFSASGGNRQSKTPPGAAATIPLVATGSGKPQRRHQRQLVRWKPVCPRRLPDLFQRVSPGKRGESVMPQGLRGPFRALAAEREIGRKGRILSKTTNLFADGSSYIQKSLFDEGYHHYVLKRTWSWSKKREGIVERRFPLFLLRFARLHCKKQHSSGL
jgi:hypothetical protein